MKYDVTVKTLAIIGLITVVCGLIGCGNQIGDGGDTDSNDNNSTSILTYGQDEPTARCSAEFLFKPVSESDGNLVLLFEKGTFFSEVYSETLGGEYELGKSAGFTNGGRLTIRFSKPGAEYTGRIIADECEFKVDEPAERQE